MKIATWNVNSLRVRLPQVLSWLTREQPDILALQEIKMENPHFPVTAFAELGYQAHWHGQKAYNGVAVLSRFAMQNVMTEFPNMPDQQSRFLAVTVDNLRIVNIYVPNGEAVASAKYEYKLNWLQRFHDFIAQQLLSYPNVIVLGDFNIAPAAEDVHNPVEAEGQVLFSAAERQALQDLFRLGLADSFRLFEQAPRSYSWWDYRALAFRRNRGWRIDHILISQSLIPACQNCRIDKIPRGWPQPSDHAPVIAGFSL